jgi:putative ATP-dependent endonuclease of OLD family
LAKEREENIVIGLEEPETNLHPQAQKELIDYFKALVSNENIIQFFFTTHSSQIIDQVEHTEIILFTKKPDSKRGFTTIIKRLPPDFYEKFSLDDFRYSQFYRYRNSDFFFSSFIVITESKNEVEIIKRIGDSAGIDYEMNGLSYLNLEGVDKAKYAIHLLSELEIPYLLIVDKDFFTPYLNDTFEDSLGINGLPLYKKQFKNEELIKSIITNEQDRSYY